MLVRSTRKRAKKKPLHKRAKKKGLYCNPSAYHGTPKGYNPSCAFFLAQERGRTSLLVTFVVLFFSCAFFVFTYTKQQQEKVVFYAPSRLLKNLEEDFKRVLFTLCF